MKKRILSFILFAFIAIGVNAQKTYAIVMGVQKYNNPSFSINDLNNTARDAKELKKLLSKNGAEVALLTGKYVTKANFNQRLSKLVNLVNRNSMQDNIIIFFSGHGMDNAMCFWDGPYAYIDLFNQLANVRAKNIFIFVDACHSGSGGQLMVNGGARINPRIAFISAARSDEASVDDAFNIINHGWFTQGMVKGLRGMSDVNKDRAVSLIELFNYIYNDVTARSAHYEQNPPVMLADVGFRRFHPQLFAPRNMHNEIVIKW